MDENRLQPEEEGNPQQGGQDPVNSDDSSETNPEMPAAPEAPVYPETSEVHPPNPEDAQTEMSAAPETEAPAVETPAEQSIEAPVEAQLAQPVEATAAAPELPVTSAPMQAGSSEETGPAPEPSPAPSAEPSSEFGAPQAPKSNKKIYVGAIAAVLVVAVGAVVFTSSTLFKGYIGQIDEAPEITNCLGDLPKVIDNQNPWEFNVSEDCVQDIGFEVQETDFGTLLAASVNTVEGDVVDGVAVTNTVNFKAETNFDDTIATVAWNFGDGNTLEWTKGDPVFAPLKAEHTYDAGGEYNVTFEVGTGKQGEILSARRSVKIAELVPPEPLAQIELSVRTLEDGSTEVIYEENPEGEEIAGVGFNINLELSEDAEVIESLSIDYGDGIGALNLPAENLLIIENEEGRFMATSFEPERAGLGPMHDYLAPFDNPYTITVTATVDGEEFAESVEFNIGEQEDPEIPELIDPANFLPGTIIHQVGTENYFEFVTPEEWYQTQPKDDGSYDRASRPQPIVAGFNNPDNYNGEDPTFEVVFVPEPPAGDDDDDDDVVGETETFLRFNSWPDRVLDPDADGNPRGQLETFLKKFLDGDAIKSLFLDLEAAVEAAAEGEEPDSVYVRVDLEENQYGDAINVLASPKFEIDAEFVEIPVEDDGPGEPVVVGDDDDDEPEPLVGGGDGNPIRAINNFTINAEELSLDADGRAEVRLLLTADLQNIDEIDRISWNAPESVDNDPEDIEDYEIDVNHNLKQAVTFFFDQPFEEKYTITAEVKAGDLSVEAEVIVRPAGLLPDEVSLEGSFSASLEDAYIADDGDVVVPITADLDLHNYEGTPNFIDLNWTVDGLETGNMLRGLSYFEDEGTKIWASEDVDGEHAPVVGLLDFSPTEEKFNYTIGAWLYIDEYEFELDTSVEVDLSEFIPEAGDDDDDVPPGDDDDDDVPPGDDDDDDVPPGDDDDDDVPPGDDDDDDVPPGDDDDDDDDVGGVASVLHIPEDPAGELIEGAGVVQALMVEAGDAVLFVPNPERESPKAVLQIFIANDEGERIEKLSFATKKGGDVQVGDDDDDNVGDDDDDDDDDAVLPGVYKVILLQGSADSPSHQKALAIVQKTMVDLIAEMLKEVAKTFYVDNDPASDFEEIWTDRAQVLFLEPNKPDQRLDDLWDKIDEIVVDGNAPDEDELEGAGDFIRERQKNVLETDDFDLAFRMAMILRSAGMAVDIMQDDAGPEVDNGPIEVIRHHVNIISVKPNITDDQRQQLLEFLMAELGLTQEEAEAIVAQLVDDAEAVTDLLVTLDRDRAKEIRSGLNALGFVNSETEENTILANFDTKIVVFDDESVTLRFTNDFEVEGLERHEYRGLYIDYGDGSENAEFGFGQDDEDIRIKEGRLLNNHNDERTDFVHKYTRPFQNPTEVTMMLLDNDGMVIAAITKVIEINIGEDGKPESVETYTKRDAEIPEEPIDPPGDDDDDDDDDDDVVDPPANPPADGQVAGNGGGGSRDAPGLDGGTPAHLAPIPATPGSGGGRFRGKFSANDIMKRSSSTSKKKESKEKPIEFKDGMTKEQVKEVVLSGNKCLVETAEAKIKKLADIGAGHSAANVLAILTEISYNGKPIIEGRVVNGKNYFNPNKPILRSEFFKLAAWPSCLAEIAEAKGIWDTSNKKRFTDLTRDFWAYDITNGLANLQIVGGYPDGSAGVAKVITRAEVTKLLVDALALRSYLEGNDDFDLDSYDKEAVLAAEFGEIIEAGRDGKAPFRDLKRSDWFYDYAVIAEAKGFTDEDFFRGNNSATRQFAAEMIYNFLIADK
jgi:hypothetical protein